MFLNYLKDFIVKKTLKSSLKNLENNFSAVTIKKVGLLIDSTTFLETEELINELIANGILEKNIKTIIYSDTIKKTEKSIHPIFNTGNLKWNGEILEKEINDFINENFDLLISFYDVEKAVLMQITHNSKAQFKVGFSSIDLRLNHFIIKTTLDNHSLFVSELFKYLKLLNKI